jgi:hypothetical protein
VLRTVRRPRHGLEPRRFDRTAVHDASAESAGLNPTEGLSHLRKSCRIHLGFRELLCRHFVGNAGITGVHSGIDELIAAALLFAFDPSRNIFFKGEKTSSVVLVGHAILHVVR